MATSVRNRRQSEFGGKSGEGEYSYQFDSITQFGNEVGRVSQLARCKGADNSSDDNLDAPHTLLEAIALAKDGGYWPEGANGLASVDMDIEGSASALRPTVIKNVVGFVPNIPALLSGQPLTMIDRQPLPIAKRYIRIGINIGRSYSVKQSSAFNRGRAIMAIVDTLSLQGFGVELVALWRNSGSIKVNVDVTIKPSDGNWNADIAAFALANTAFQRRLVWRFVESQQGASAITQDSYGNGVNEKGDDFDIYFGYVTPSKESKWETPENALNSARQEVEMYLNPSKAD